MPSQFDSFNESACHERIGSAFGGFGGGGGSIPIAGTSFIVLPTYFLYRWPTGEELSPPPRNYIIVFDEGDMAVVNEFSVLMIDTSDTYIGIDVKGAGGGNGTIILNGHQLTGRGGDGFEEVVWKNSAWFYHEEIAPTDNSAHGIGGLIYDGLGHAMYSAYRWLGGGPVVLRNGKIRFTAENEAGMEFERLGIVNIDDADANSLISRGRYYTYTPQPFVVTATDVYVFWNAVSEFVQLQLNDGGYTDVGAAEGLEPGDVSVGGGQNYSYVPVTLYKPGNSLPYRWALARIRMSDHMLINLGFTDYGTNRRGGHWVHAGGK